MNFPPPSDFRIADSDPAKRSLIKVLFSLNLRNLVKSLPSINYSEKLLDIWLREIFSFVNKIEYVTYQKMFIF